jgi:hypothetical protein
VLVLLVLLQAAAPPSDASQTLAPMSLERATRELERPRIRLDTPPEQPTFRIEVRGLLPTEPWIDRETAPWPKIIPRDHYEYLATVTPEEFRGAVLHPCCIPVLTIVESIGQRLAASRRARGEARAKQVVEQALREWRAAQAKDK